MSELGVLKLDYGQLVLALHLKLFKNFCGIFKILM